MWVSNLKEHDVDTAERSSADYHSGQKAFHPHWNLKSLRKRAALKVKVA